MSNWLHRARKPHKTCLVLIVGVHDDADAAAYNLHRNLAGAPNRYYTELSAHSPLHKVSLSTLPPAQLCEPSTYHGMIDKDRGFYPNQYDT